MILVPIAYRVEPECELGLSELERRGYLVRRVYGYSAVDQARCQIVSDALHDGFTETFWIDSDIAFHPDDVDRIRAHGLPICTGIYAKKNRRELAAHVLPGTPRIVFGRQGGLVELLYAGCGFMHVRSAAYEVITRELGLPLCNERFGHPLVPFFQPLVVPLGSGHWYLAEDFAFCGNRSRPV